MMKILKFPKMKNVSNSNFDEVNELQEYNE